MEERHFDVDPLTGAVETFYFDHTDDTFTIERREDVEPIIEVAKALYNDAPSDWKGDWHRVASIPLTLLPDLEKKGIMTAGGRIIDDKKLKQWLNDSSNRYFRTRPGRI
jgi:hypothetical protein